MSVLTLPRPKFAAVPDLLRHAPAASLLAVTAGLYVVAASSLAMTTVPLAESAARTIQAAAAQVIASPAAAATDPAALAPISATEAALRNAALPVESGPNPAAAAFTLPADEVARMRSIDCLTAAVYYEAANESVDGQRGVAQVVLNRVRHPHYPKSVCGVVFQGHQRTTGCQFSFTCDGSLRRTPAGHLWERSRKVAEEALAGYVHRPVGWATHYHANYVFPYWAPSLAKVGQIGAHIFYRWDGGWGRPGAFAGRYAGAEPAIAWRGGFGQVPRTDALATDTAAAIALPVDVREAAAAAAAVEARKEEPAGGTAFLRSVVRRYEPVRESTDRILQQRAQTQPATNSNRWAVTGQGAGGTQRPLGKEDAPAQPVVLDGVRRRPGAAPANSSGEAK
jgi:spore germination cell wall hydrolase CwlJ-like protein